ncbi:MAG: hypothetical protein ABSC22_17790 [Roseiarcus sp.]|jgi:hypothetical protein
MSFARPRRRRAHPFDDVFVLDNFGPHKGTAAPLALRNGAAQTLDVIACILATRFQAERASDLKDAGQAEIQKQKALDGN